MTDNDLGQRVRTARREAGLTVVRLSAAANVSTRTIELLELPGIVPGAPLLERVAGVLHVTLAPKSNGAGRKGR